MDLGNLLRIGIGFKLQNFIGPKVIQTTSTHG